MNRPDIPQKEAFSDLLVLTGLCLLGMVLFSGIGLFLISRLTGLDPMELGNFTNPDSENKNLRIGFLCLQGLISLGSFVLLPWMIRFLRPVWFQEENLKPSFPLILLVLVLGLLMLPVNGWLAAWNQNIRLPGFLDNWQSWAMEKEAEMEKLTSFLVNFSSLSEGLLGFLVISLIAGISEEFFFRKQIQPRLISLTGNPHTGIWLTAFLFSAIHLQFYGLFPRMVLGGLFGYYYFWTGNIRIAMLAHAFNNGITLLGMVLYQQKVSPLNMENPDEIPWYLGGISAGLVWSISGIVRQEAVKIRRLAALQHQAHKADELD